MAAQLKPGQGPLDYGNRFWLKVLFAAIFFVSVMPPAWQGSGWQ